MAEKRKRSTTKYIYNEETLDFEPIERRSRDYFFPIILFVCGIIISSVGLSYFQIITSPNEYLLEMENDVLKNKYELLDKEIDKLDAMILVLQERDENIYRVITEADSLPKSLRNAGIGGVKRHKELFELGISHKTVQIVVDKLATVEELKRQMYIQTKSYDEIVEQAKQKAEMLASIPAIQPCNKYKRIASGFGWRMHPILKVRKFHKGLDFAAHRGTPIYAPGDGVIEKTKTSYGGYGKQVLINHGFGYQTRYAHMQRFVVKKGQKVKRGQLIGYVGNTGRSTGPHLHYEVIKNGKTVNPVHFFFKDLTPEEYEVILQQASEENQSMS